jgi:aldehyde dehydrogenase (NAD+)
LDAKRDANGIMKLYIMEPGQIIQKQRDFFNSNKTKDIGFRIELLKKVKSLLKENEKLLCNAIYEDFGKSEFETYATEFSLLYQEIDIAVRKIKKWSKNKRVATGLINFPGNSYIIPEPLGVTLIIGAWNYPYQLSFLPAITALAAGNTVILKPSELPSRTSKAIATLINSNLDSSCFFVIEGGVSETKELLEHRFDKIFFTGSIPVGRLIYQAAAKHLTPVTLELGGKSPTFVFSDCDIKIAARRIVWAKFLNAGQTCVAPDYLLVEESAEERLMNALFEELEKYPKNPQKFPEHYTKIINDKNFERLNNLIDRSKLCYGGHVDKELRFISPTILKGVSFDDTIMEDEIFGPILPVLPFSDLDETIKKVKMRPKPLSCYIYSSNRKTVKKTLKEISFGGGAVNDSIMHLTNSKLPFGGVGFSGIGSYHAKAGFDTFTHYKSILHKPFWLEPKLKYPPYTQIKKRLLRKFFN